MGAHNDGPTTWGTTHPAGPRVQRRVRRRDWHPLSDTDPTPGDPEAIREEARRMRGIAEKLRDQSHDLKTIAQAKDFKGRYAKDLKDKAGNLEKRLREVAERYEHVAGKTKSHGPLMGWAEELEGLQQRAEDLHDQAQQEAKDEKKKSKHKHGGTDSPQKYPDEQGTDAQSRLTTLTQDYKERASHYADKINSAIGDIIKDSKWENFKDGVSAVVNNKWVKLIFEAAGWAAAIIGIVALFWCPATWWMAALLAFSEYATYAIAAKDVLALATGNGNWSDVAWDALAVGTMGVGKVVGKGLKSSHAAAKAAGSQAAGAKAQQASIRGSRSAIERANKVMGTKRGTTPRQRAEAQLRKQRIHNKAVEAGDKARTSEMAREPEVSKSPLKRAKETVQYAGSTKQGGQAKEMTRLRGEYPKHAGVQGATSNLNRLRGVSTGAWAGSFTSGAVPKTFGQSGLIPWKPYSHEYRDWRERQKVDFATGY